MRSSPSLDGKDVLEKPDRIAATRAEIINYIKEGEGQLFDS